MSDCIFCKIVKKEMPTEVVYEDDFMIVFPDIRPKAEVHLLLVTKEHIKNISETDNTHAGLLFHMLQQAPKLAVNAGLPGFRLITNNGVAAGQEIEHLHFHVLGNKTGNKKLPGF